MTALMICICFLIVIIYQRELNSRNRVLKSVEQVCQAQQNIIRDLNSCFTAQKNYVKSLEEERLKHTELTSKVEEVVSLLPSNDHEFASVVMFQKLQDAQRLVDKHNPESELAKELKELLR